ncbi:hypothetical protein B0T17DRAFT_510258 [Bombardia bombarda]|uniref:Uncharacterized protein n=1 Tax=Bombardia bombarda TaxID=252184 RepID=A0AA39WHU9_9PEZI|nr:hypothetical protein B0T17DRAFT_510258 [Bombardia bombarda]
MTVLVSKTSRASEVASGSMMSKIPTTQMIAQAFFHYSASSALSGSSRSLSPSIWVAIYDPTLTLEEAFANGYTRMVLINANGIAAINLGLNQRQTLGKALAYDYQLSISTIPSLKLNCDVSNSEAVSRA